ncbi:MAG: TMEM43 family protein [Patescibacteria group bacterium]
MRFLLGILFVLILSPLTVWYAESQHRAKDFKKADQIEATVVQEGYITFEGQATSDAPLDCPGEVVVNDNNCLYANTTISEWTREEKTVCGERPAQDKILYSEEPRCDSDGECEECWRVEEFDWKQLSSNDSFTSFKVGAYTITPNASVKYISPGTSTEYYTDDLDFIDSLTAPVEGDEKYTYTYVELDQNLRIAGSASAAQIRDAGDRIFVISPLSWAGTLDALQGQDRSTMWALRVVSLLLMIGGFIMIASPLTSLSGALFGIIPVLGKKAHKPIASLVNAIAGAIGFAVWIVVWLSVLLLKNLWWIAIVALAVGLIVMGMKMMKDKKAGGGDGDGKGLMDKVKDTVKDKVQERIEEIKDIQK